MAARFDPDGSLDPGFGGGAPVIDKAISFGVSYAFVSDHATLHGTAVGSEDAGGMGDFRWMVLRYRSDGALEDQFGQGGVILTRLVNTPMAQARAWAVAEDPATGTIVVGGLVQIP